MRSCRSKWGTFIVEVGEEEREEEREDEGEEEEE